MFSFALSCAVRLCKHAPGIRQPALRGGMPFPACAFTTILALLRLQCPAIRARHALFVAHACGNVLTVYQLTGLKGIMQFALMMQTQVYNAAKHMVWPDFIQPVQPHRSQQFQRTPYSTTCTRDGCMPSKDQRHTGCGIEALQRDGFLALSTRVRHRPE